MTAPFDISGRFRTYGQHPDIGVFDRLYELRELSRDEVELMGEWLSLNCTKNFIFLELTSVIIAGGTSDHALAWKQRYKQPKRERVTDHQLKLYRNDATFFELAWDAVCRGDRDEDHNTR